MRRRACSLRNSARVTCAASAAPTCTPPSRPPAACSNTRATRSAPRSRTLGRSTSSSATRPCCSMPPHAATSNSRRISPAAATIPCSPASPAAPPRWAVACCGAGSIVRAELAHDVGEFPALHDLLKRAIIDNPPMVIRDGGVIAAGYDAELDELRQLSENAGQFLVDLETRERVRTGIANLKVNYNRVHGFYIELTRGQAEKAPADYIRRQTLKGAERYITPELKSFEDKVLSARERALAREKLLYDELLDQLLPHIPALQTSAAALAELDVLANFAERA